MPAPLNESQLLEFAKSIELLSTKVLEGMHRSRRGGEGLEFHSARPYSEGEDSRFIDWKRFAATDRYFVKNFERTEKTAWTIVLDRSASMNYAKKKDWLQKFSASLIYIANAVGDSWTLWPHGPLDISTSFASILSGDCGADLPSLKDFHPRVGDRILILSDFMFDPEPWRSSFEEISSEGHWLHLVQILSPEEQSFQFENVIDFRDLEGHEKLILDSKSTRSSYLKALQQLRADWKQQLPERATWLEVVADPNNVMSGLLEFFEAL